ncbi:MAG: metal transporter [SAR86 cluster bacterium]|uniref:Metal transporter n=1 Tax=SAR86 cluster bacterium TaxID=2030880 RepID=A0A2A4MP75_9GAMM|nr:MAG: metal transporter [SAR86 cluster bacterium]
MLRILLALKLAFRKRQLSRHSSTSIVKRISFLMSMLLGLILVNTSGMILFEKMVFADALWLSFTTVTTVGYGDFSPVTFGGRLITVLSMYTFSISLLSMIAAEIIEARLMTTDKKRRGLWEWKGMKNHIQIINTPNEDTERYLKRLILQIQQTPSLQDTPLQLLTRKYPDGLPDSLNKLKVIHRTGSAEDGNILQTLNLEQASHIVILARDATSSLSDSISFDILNRVMEMNHSATVVVEAVLDENRERFLKSGASAVLRPIRAYPEMVVRALTHPGTEQILENLFQIEGDSLHRVEHNFTGKSWKEILLTCIEHEIGLPLGYMHKGAIVINPSNASLCAGDALVLLVKEGKDVPLQKIIDNI